MSKDRFSYVPDIVSAQYRQGLSEIPTQLPMGLYQEPIASWDDIDEVGNSMARYANDMNSFFLASWIQEFQRPDQQIPEGNFSLVPISKGPGGALCRNIESPFSKETMYLDGYCGFGLFFKPETTGNYSWLATVGIAPISNLKTYSSTLLPISDEHKDDADPVIIQIQGKYTNQYADQSKWESNKNTLQTFRWEHVLTASAIGWAQSVQFPSIYLLPASMNRWNTSERFAQRYNSSAHKFGFRKDESGLYVRQLQPNG